MLVWQPTPKLCLVFCSQLLWLADSSAVTLIITATIDTTAGMTHQGMLLVGAGLAMVTTAAMGRMRTGGARTMIMTTVAGLVDIMTETGIEEEELASPAYRRGAVRYFSYRRYSVKS
jgi:hypothetical protein